MSDCIKRVTGIAALCIGIICCVLSAAVSGNNRTRFDYSGTARNRSLSGSGKTEGTVAVNLCSAEELTELSGIGETLAAYIVNERDLNGPFYYPEDLLTVRGIGPAKLNRFRNQLDMSD